MVTISSSEDLVVPMIHWVDEPVEVQTNVTIEESKQLTTRR